MDLVVQQYQAFARYNAWMNGKLYDVAGTLTDEERKRDLGAFFRSVHGTFNHLLLADRVWLFRFTRDKAVIDSRDASGGANEIRTVDQILYEDFATLRQERERTDTDFLRWTAGLTNEALAAPFRYSSMVNPQTFEQPLWCLVTHIFNHQTHHRGQATTLLKQLGRDPGVTDLAAMLRTESQSR